MTTAKLETQVKKQSELLAKEMPDILAIPKMEGKFVAYLNGEKIFEDTHAECFEKAEKKFGSQGFAIAEVKVENQLILSALIKLAQ